MRIAVLSDTHNRLPETLLPRIADADEIWHLGDVCDERILVTLGKLAPLRYVRGNCDDVPDWPLVLEFEIEGIRFHLEHIPTVYPPECDVFLHGHTHVPRDETIRRVRFLNPGCIGHPKFAPPSFAWLILENGTLSWKIMPLESEHYSL